MSHFGWYYLQEVSNRLAEEKSASDKRIAEKAVEKVEVAEFPKGFRTSCEMPQDKMNLLTRNGWISNPVHDNEWKKYVKCQIQEADELGLFKMK